MTRHATANALRDLTPGPAAALINMVALRADVIGFQECETQGHIDAVQALTRHGYDVFWPKGSPTIHPANAVPIVWRTSLFDLVSTGVKRTTVGEHAVTPNRYITVAVLRDKATGRPFARINTHMISQAFTDHPERKERWDEHAALLEVITKGWASKMPVIGGGDLNRDGWKMPAGPSGGAVMTYGNPTYKGRRYDALWSVGMTASGIGTLQTPSDHDALFATFTPKNAPTKPPVTPPKEPTVVTSYNGWSASTTLKLRPLVVNGVAFEPGIRDDPDVYTVLKYVAEQVAKRVEPLVDPGCWGFNFRMNRNASNLSNHASGTAIDINAPQHPNGQKATRSFTSKEIATIHQICAETDHTIRWGGDYTGTPDSMHFEVNATKAQLHRAALKLTNPQQPHPTPTGDFEMAQADVDALKKWVQNLMIAEDRAVKDRQAIKDQLAEIRADLDELKASK